MVQILPCREDRFDGLVAFIANLNRLPNHHIGYFGLEPQEIAATLQQLNPPPEESFLLAYDGDILVGALGYEADAEVGRIWLYGPFVDAVDWAEVADALYLALLPTLPLQIGEQELFCEARNSECMAFASRHSFPLHSEAAIWSITRAQAAVLPPTEAKELPPDLEEAFATLHTRLFPRTYLPAPQLLARRGPHERLFAVTTTSEVLAYAFVKVDLPIDEGYVDYVGVAEQARQQGLGRQVLTAALRWIATFPNVQRINLTVHTSNHAAMRLYAALGFTQERLMRGYRKQISTSPSAVHR